MPSTFHVIFWNTNISNSNHEKIPLEVRYNGWHYPHENWKAWVKQMHHKYEHVWIEAGIDQAIKASTFQIRRNDELILEPAQRWCSKTNTFVFPCGEATITLEDMKGRSYATDEHFMSNESRVEHEGFLSLWLSRFVFPPKSYNAISKNVFPIAVHLARGSKIALAPAVLAGIYRDLRLLNNKIRTATKVEVGVKLWTPFQLAQVWALERFPLLHSRLPHGIRQGKLMVAKWHKVKMLKHDSFKLILDSLRARNGFIWRPYKNSPPLELYNEKDMWACNNPNYFDELESFARCLRVSVGMECVEQYGANRIAMQFGMDQDIPDKNLYTALRAWHASRACHQPNVTSGYYHWWNQSNPSKEEDIHDGCVVSSSEHLLQTLSSGKKEGGGSDDPPPDFTSKFKREQEENFDEVGKLSIIILSSDSYLSSDARCFGEDVGNGEASSIVLYMLFHHHQGLKEQGVSMAMTMESKSRIHFVTPMMLGTRKGKMPAIV
ncbi:hypothetical protein JHK86_023155 [Glycine max]|nr:hypothetical protein JHK86_023155 [Glycine max]